MPMYNQENFKLDKFETKDVSEGVKLNTLSLSGRHTVELRLITVASQLDGKRAVIQYCEENLNGHIFVQDGESVRFWSHFDVPGAPAMILNLAAKKKALQLAMLDE
ncbi:hypothetical protein SS50377_25885 [Spironucleus salmonicida]|nr:hypothetical protein SS50377_25885 [Spironucleus salmonicida]|eukprot:EST47340.1 Hypothetical protein SS50377_12614 [Spironucleus salmonicida]